MSTSDSVNVNVNKSEQKTPEIDTDTPVVKFVGYSEDNPDHKPDPFFQTGTLDTSDTGGTAQNSIRDVSPVFDIARAQNLQAAAKALDPDDDSVPSELVILPQGEVTVTGTVKTADEGKEDVLREVRKLQEHPVEVGGLTRSQQEAAEDTSDSSSLDAEGNTVVEDSGTKTEEKSDGSKTEAEKAAAERAAAEKAEADKKTEATKKTTSTRGTRGASS